MSALGNILILMILMFIIFSIMGCYLFTDIKYVDYRSYFSIINKYYNFDNFYFSFMLVFRSTSGESWPIMMTEYAKVNPNVVGPYVSNLYFVGMIFICAVIMLNLFVLVALQQYDEFHQKEENPIERFEEILDSFKKSWNKFSNEIDKGERIIMTNVTEFLMKLEGDLAFDLKDHMNNYHTINSREKAVRQKLKREITDLQFMT